MANPSIQFIFKTLGIFILFLILVQDLTDIQWLPVYFQHLKSFNFTF